MEYLVVWKFRNRESGVDWCKSIQEAKILVGENSFSESKIYMIGEREMIYNSNVDGEVDSWRIGDEISFDGFLIWGKIIELENGYVTIEEESGFTVTREIEDID